MARVPAHHSFPDPRSADADGLVARGGDFDPDRLLSAYRRGIFPWPESPRRQYFWFSPDPRLIFEPGRFHISRRLARQIRSEEFEIRLDTSFVEVMRTCGEIPRRNHPAGSWITPTLRESFAELHQRGHAHSIETWREGTLVGGAYGLGIGRAFFAESMFSAVPNASKVALAALCRFALDREIGLIDAQVPSDHLLSLGGIVIDRDAFLQRLAPLVDQPSIPGPWAWTRGRGGWI